MKVLVTGSKNPFFEQELIAAAKFYGKELLSKQLYKHIHIEIVLVSTISDLGNCSITYYNDWYKPREFEIQLKRKKSTKSMIQTLAHEMVHLKQFAKGELNDNHTKWRGQNIDSESISYYDLPWEIEASSMEYILYAMYQEYRQQII